VRSYLPAYDLRAPKDLPEALALLDTEPGVWQPLAGGTDLMVLFEAGKLPHKKFLSIWKLAELKGIQVAPGYVTLGALTTYTQVMAHPILRQEFPLLCQAAQETGGIATQNRGTLAGNIANASPAADSPPALLIYDAELELISACGSRRVPYHGFHTDYKKMLLRPDELIRSIRLPRAGKHWRQYFRKVGTRKAQAISKVCFAAAAVLEGEAIRDVRIVLGSVAPTVLRCVKTEAALRGQRLGSSAVDAARAELSREIVPIDDLRSTARYRLRVAQNLLEEFLQQLISDGRAGAQRG
jgi:CO/xanthine dehydrogenase FAD-binding subunit